MMESELERAELKDFLTQTVVLDTRGPLLYLGTLDSIGEAFFTLTNADVHDMASATKSKEVYIMESAKHGVRTNRASVHVRKTQIVSISKLSDVVLY